MCLILTHTFIFAWQCFRFIFLLYIGFYFLFALSLKFASVKVPPRGSTCLIGFVIVQLLSGVWLFATPWTATRQASLSFTISQSLLKLMSIESMMPSIHLILCHPLLLPLVFLSIGSFPESQLFPSGGHSIGVSASASVLPVNIQG